LNAHRCEKPEIYISKNFCGVAPFTVSPIEQHFVRIGKIHLLKFRRRDTFGFDPQEWIVRLKRRFSAAERGVSYTESASSKKMCSSRCEKPSGNAKCGHADLSLCTAPEIGNQKSKKHTIYLVYTAFNKNQSKKLKNFRKKENTKRQGEKPPAFHFFRK